MTPISSPFLPSATAQSCEIVPVSLAASQLSKMYTRSLPSIVAVFEIIAFCQVVVSEVSNCIRLHSRVSAD